MSSPESTGNRWTVDAIGVDGAYRTRARIPITTLVGEPVGELSQVPALYITKTLRRLEQAPEIGVDDRLAMLAKAGDLYRNGVVDGQSPTDYADAVATCSGVPARVVERSVEAVARTLLDMPDVLLNAMPRGAVMDWQAPETLNGSGVWVRWGRTFAVIASGNTPGVHALWLESLALGYAVAVRPSAREPFTPQRLIGALRAVGFHDHVAMLPCDYAGADLLVDRADRSLVYGGADVVAKYSDNPRVLIQGPGRSKMLITADVDWRDHLDLIADSISALGGAACTCTTSVLVEDSPDEFAAAVAARLADLADEQPETRMSVTTAPRAQALLEYLSSITSDAVAVLGVDQVAHPQDSGAVGLGPAVHRVAAGAPQLNVELPFPCVWVAPYERGEGVGPVRDSLVLTAMTTDADLVGRLLAEPSIGNVYVGAHPTTWMKPGVPHDGYLADHLMRTKAVIR